MKHSFWRVGIVSAVVLVLVVAQALATAPAAQRPLWDPSTVRPPIVVGNGLVVAGHPLATQAGMQILQQGGNAVDAAVATAAVLSVTVPDMIGPLGSGYALIYTSRDRKLIAADFNGEAPSGARPELFTREKLRRGILAGTIPGTLRGWEEMIKRYGKLNLAKDLAPAIQLAEKGFPIDYESAMRINANVAELAGYDTWVKTYYAKGRAVRAGEIFVQPDLARSLKKIAAEGAQTVYGGELGRELVRWVQSQGGLWTLDDLKNYKVQWKEPIRTTYRGLDVYGVPPGASAITWMQLLKIMEGYDVKAMGHNSVEYLHTFIEATKLAYMDAYRYVADPNFVQVPVQTLLSDAHAAELRARIDPNKPWIPPVHSPQTAPYIGTCTTHMIIIDKDRNIVSMTNTLGTLFGAGLVVGNSGMLMSNGMDWFDTDIHPWTGEKSVGQVQPHKRNRWTLAPGMLFKDGRPYIVVGGAGAEMTMYGIAQPLINVIDFGMNVAQAIDAPRFRWGDVYHYTGGRQVWLQWYISDEVAQQLAARGHDVAPTRLATNPGTTQMAMIDPASGALIGWFAIGRGYAMGW